MGKREISKHSRAARRAVADAPEVAELSKMPRVSNKPDIANYIVRTTNKNEELLEQKLRRRQAKNAKRELKGISKEFSAGARTRRGIDFGGKLSTKIQKSIQKGLHVLRRKMTWEQIDEEARKERERLNSQRLAQDDAEPSKKKKKTDQLEEMEEDKEEEESDFFDEKEDGDDKKNVKSLANAFALLEEEAEA